MRALYIEVTVDRATRWCTESWPLLAVKMDTGVSLGREVRDQRTLFTSTCSFIISSFLRAGLCLV